MMANRMADLSPRSTSLIAGFGYLVIFISGIFSNFFVLQNLTAPGDAATTANNIIANEMLFRIGISGFIIMVIFDVVLAWALYILLIPVNRNLSLLAAWFRLLNAAIFGFALYHLFGVLELISGAEYLAVIETNRLYVDVMLLLDAFNDIWLIGLIFFAAHLIVLGFLALKSGYIPKLLGILLIIAALGYLTDSSANFLLPDYEIYAPIFAIVVFVPAFIVELLFCLWLIFKGVGKVINHN